MKHNQKIGKLGQKIAVKYLKNKGYKILAQNLYFRRGEIDILAKNKGNLVFIEVKTRTNLKFGYPEQAISDKKYEHLESAINSYLIENDYKGDYFLEIISITIDLNNKKAYIKHFV